MTDGTTGIQVAPVTEDEMSKAQDVVRRMVDSIVDLSKLRHDYDELAKQVHALRSDVEHYRNTIASQDETISRLRRERDEAQAEAVEARREQDRYKSEYYLELERSEKRATVAEQLEANLSRAKHERDDYGLQVMELEEKLKTAEGKLTEIRDYASSIFGFNVSAPAPAMQPTVELSTKEQEPPPSTEPEPSTSPTWVPDYDWDPDQQLYVRRDPEAKPTDDWPF